MGREIGASPHTSLPSRHILQAALRVGQLVDEQGAPVGRLRAAYPNMPTDGLFDADDLQRGEVVLKEAGLLEVGAEGIARPEPPLGILRRLEPAEARRVLLKMWLRIHPPLWLRVAVGMGGVREPYIPDRARRTLAGLFPDEDLRHGFLAGLGIPASPDDRHELGRRGENAVVRACRRQRRTAGYPKLAERVQRVSRLSDAFGYDVSAPRPGADRPAYHFEVKTAGHRGAVLRIHLSRHQVQVGRHDPCWRVVVCSPEEDSIGVVGWCTLDQLTDVLPDDGADADGVTARWDSVEVRIVRDKLQAGLPPLK